jgi:hypothetical protein
MPISFYTHTIFLGYIGRYGSSIDNFYCFNQNFINIMLHLYL